MALDGSTASFIPYTLNGLQDIALDSSTVTTIQVNSLTPNRVVVSDGSNYLVSAGATTTEVDYLSGTTSNVQTQLNSKASLTYVDTNFLNKTTSTQQNVQAFCDFKSDLTTDNVYARSAYYIPKTTFSTHGWSITRQLNGSVLKDLLFRELENNVDCLLLSEDGQTVYVSLKCDYATASKIPIFDANKKLVSSGVDALKITYLDNVSSDIQTQLNGKLNLSGSNANQNIVIGTYKVQSSAVPSVNTDYTNKLYVDSAITAGTATVLRKADVRAGIAPSAQASETMSWYFGTHSNNNVTPYADLLLPNGWVDSSGGKVNMISFNKGTAGGIRQYQGTHGSATNFSDYYDCVMTDLNSSNVTLTGTLAMGANKITTSYTPINADDVTRKGYVDSLVSNLLTTDNTWTGINTFSRNPSPIVLSGLTANRLIGLGTLKEITTINATLIEGSYLSGVTSSIQTQLDARVLKAGDTMTGQLEISTANFNPLLLTRTSAGNNFGVGTVHSLVSSGGFRGFYTRTLGGSNGNVATSSQSQANGYYAIDCANAGVFGSDTSPSSSTVYISPIEVVNRVPTRIVRSGGASLMILHNSNYVFNEFINERYFFGDPTGTNRSAFIQATLTTGNKTNFLFYTDPGTGTALERLRINGDGNVGIGTDPSSKLHMYNDGTYQVRFQTSAVDNHYITAAQDLYAFNANLSLTGIPNTGRGSCQIILQTPTAGGFIQFLTGAAVNTAPSERMRITGDGNLGLGTTNPGTYRLNVVGNSLTSGVVASDVANPYSSRASNPFTFNFAASATSARLYTGAYYTAGAGACGAIQASDFYSALDHGVDLLINPIGGVVGIGTNSPNLNWAGNAIPNNKLTISSGVAGGVGALTRISIGGNASHYSAIEAQHIGSGATTLSLLTCESAFVNGSNPFTRLFINATGQIGIGTDTSLGSYRLYVNGSTALAGQVDIGISGLSANTTPNLKLASSASHIDNNPGEVWLFTGYQGNLAIGKNGTRDATTTNLVVGVSGLEESQLVSVNTNNTAYKPMVFAASQYAFISGAVGIGTNSPAGLLDVYSTTADYTNSAVVRTPWASVVLDNTQIASGRRWSLLSGGPGAGVGQGNFGIFDITGGAYRLAINSAGNVGIGTEIPGFKVHWYGNTNAGVEQYGQNASSGSGAYTLIGVRNNTPSQLVMFLNSTGRTVDGGASTGTLRNDAGSLRLQSSGGNGFEIDAASGFTRKTGGDSSKILFGPNTTWSSYLLVGAGGSELTGTTAQIISTNGNLHLDAAFSKDFYVNYYAWLNGTVGTNYVYGNTRLRNRLTVGSTDASRTMVTVTQGTNGTIGGGLFGNIAAWPDGANGCLYSQDSPTGANSAGLFCGYNGLNLTSYITSLAPNVAWIPLYIYAEQTAVFFQGGLAAYTNGGGWVNVSDEREKEDIQPLKTESSLSRIMALKPKHYRRKYIDKDTSTSATEETKQQRHVGFIAQEVLESNRHCVSSWCNKDVQSEEDDGQRFGISYNDFIVHLVGGMQEQQKQLEVLTKRNQILEDHARKLEADFAEYKDQTDRRMTQLAELVRGLLEEPKLKRTKTIVRE